MNPMSPKSPTRSSSRSSRREGFRQLSPRMSVRRGNFSPRGEAGPSDEHIINIPLTPIETNTSTSGARKEGQTVDPGLLDNVPPEASTPEHGSSHRGRRRTNPLGATEEGKVTAMGKFYRKILDFSLVTRYFLYIVPLGAIFAIWIAVGFTRPEGQEWTVGGTPIQWFFIWMEVVWTSLWVSKLVAKALPFVFETLMGVVSSGVKKYSQVIKSVEFALSLVGWAIASSASFLPLVTRYPGHRDAPLQLWQDRLRKVLVSCLISSIIILVERLIIQIISVDYHRRQFADRINENKRNVRFLAQMYEVSRNMFPVYTEFVEEDYLIHQGLVGRVPGFGGKRSGAVTPMRQFFGNINVIQGKVTGAFGNIAQEVTGNKNLLNPNSAYAVVLEALSRKKSAEALARRIWMSFVSEGETALTKEDMLEVMTQAHAEEAEACFYSLDKDLNGDVSLDEMVMHVMQLQKERRDIAKSMTDVGNAIEALNKVLAFIVFIIIVIVFVTAQQESVGTTIAGAGTVLISLSFVFAITAQEILGSCIFLFVKHPYDVGDRVDVDDRRYIVEHISLLYTVFRRVESQKTTQIPNNILNTKPIDNITRSKFMQEQLIVPVEFGTSFEDIQKLEQELAYFCRENARDFQPDIDVEIVGVNKLDQLELRIEIKHKANWSNEQLTLQRRNKFICALVEILRKIPIYGPAGGDPGLGEQGKPMYYVTVSDEDARKEMEKAAKAKQAKRWDYHESDDDYDSDHDDGKDDGKNPRAETASGSTAVNIEPNAAGQQRARSPFSDHTIRDDASVVSRMRAHELRSDITSSSGLSRMRSTDTRRSDLETVRGILDRTLSTQGRRKPSQTPSGAHRVEDRPRDTGGTGAAQR